MDAAEIAGILGPGARYEGALVFQGRVRIDGELIGDVQSDDFVEIGPRARIKGNVEVPQALVAGQIDGTLRASERVTLLETAVIVGKIVTPWLDVRVGAQLRAEVIVAHAKGE